MREPPDAALHLAERLRKPAGKREIIEFAEDSAVFVPHFIKWRFRHGATVKRVLAQHATGKRMTFTCCIGDDFHLQYNNKWPMRRIYCGYRSGNSVAWGLNALRNWPDWSCTRSKTSCCTDRDVTR